MSQPQPGPPDIFDRALAALRLGLRPFPLPAGKKGAQLKDWPELAARTPAELKALWAWSGAGSNYGLLMGACMLLKGLEQYKIVALDADERPGLRGLDCLALLEQELGKLPETPRQLTGHNNGSCHIFLLVPAHLELRSVNLDPLGGVQLKAHNSYVVGPGSVIDTGPYEWEALCEPPEVSWGFMPQRWIDHCVMRSAREARAREHEPVDPGRREKPGDYVNEWSWHELLTWYGAEYVGTKWVDGEPRSQWLRPEGTVARSENDHSAVVLDGGLWTYTPNWPGLPDSNATRRPISKFGFYTAMTQGEISDEAFSRAKEDLKARFNVPEPEPEPFMSPELPSMKRWLEEEARHPLGDDQDPVEGLAALRARIEAEKRVRLIDRVLWDHGIGTLPPPEPLVDGFLDQNTVSMIYGPYGKGKSFLALDWALHVATGRPWVGRAVQQGLVVYLVAEGAPGTNQRLRAWCQHHLGDPDALLGHQLAWVPYGANLTDPAVVEQALELVYELHPALLIIDTVARTSVGMDENSAKEMGAYVDAMNLLREAGESIGCPLCVLPVHHSGKDNGRGARGHTSLPAATSGLFEVTRPEDDGPVKLHTERQKDRESAPDQWFTMLPVGESIVLEPTEDPEGGGAGSGADRRPAQERPVILANCLHRLADMDDGSGVLVSGWADDVLRGRVVDSKGTFDRVVKVLRERGYTAERTEGRARRRSVSATGRAFLARVETGEET